MSLYYRGDESARPDGEVLLEQVARNDRPEDYSAGPKLAAAVNVALVLGKPLLVTGEPGTGKTELARHVAMALSLPEPERFDTKSTSQAMELFYRFDNLARFHSANVDRSPRRALDFITFGPLGRAILRSLPPDSKVFEALQIRHPGESPSGTGAGAAAARRSVILIDEIDKAPRDFPNDLLDAIQNLRFGIRELDPQTLEKLAAACGGQPEITAAEKLRPIVIITSNSEKNLPAPFLRRCVYYHIPVPDQARLRLIVARRVGGMTTLNEAALRSALGLKPDEAQPLLRSAASFFEKIRNEDLSKPPSAAELIDWLRYLMSAGAKPTQELKDISGTVRDSLGVLVKSVEDLEALERLATDESLRQL